MTTRRRCRSCDLVRWEQDYRGSRAVRVATGGCWSRLWRCSGTASGALQHFKCGRGCCRGAVALKMLQWRSSKLTDAIHQQVHGLHLASSPASCLASSRASFWASSRASCLASARDTCPCHTSCYHCVALASLHTHPSGIFKRHIAGSCTHDDAGSPHDGQNHCLAGMSAWETLGSLP
jgi:hypothetical protein